MKVAEYFWYVWLAFFAFCDMANYIDINLVLLTHKV